MNIKEIKEMISLMKENDITEFEMEKDGFKVKLKKGADFMIAPDSVMVKSQPVQVVSGPGGTKAAKDIASGAKDEVAVEDQNIEIVKSPMVGTFYKAASPDAEPFVQVGQAVQEGDTLCIIEAMKLMNEIKAEVKGKIVEVLVDNGQAVEFDQPLFKIKK
ncbi:MAG: acetyl-CoA carboxylase biotin carboxyl carrier protein [Candidatus Omnitrophica bacterium]|nr:acetyl-CoA carboxylase biotin carboxyl carrier protein [Candidatus Omnitrophota bacterium]